MKDNKTYKYVIYLKHPIFPRKLSDELENAGLEVIKVRDLQNNQHMYGSTYYAKGKQEYREPFKTMIKCLLRK